MSFYSAYDGQQGFDTGPKDSRMMGDIINGNIPNGYIDRFGDYHSVDQYGGSQNQEYQAQYKADQAWKKANPSGYGPGGPALQSLLQQATPQATTSSTSTATSVPSLYPAAGAGTTTPQTTGGTSTSNVTGGVPGMDSSYPYLLQAAAASDPMAADRSQYMSQLKDLVTNGSSSFAQDPSYQNRLKAGLEGVTRSQAAQGYLGSGNMMTALVDYAGNKASEEYGNQFNRLASLAGVDKSSPTAAGNILAQYPSQNLAEKSAQFSWDQQSQMLPYQLQQMAAAAQTSSTDNLLKQITLPNQINAASLQQQLLQSQADAALKAAQMNRNSIL